jgi:uncharacterized protein
LASHIVNTFNPGSAAMRKLLLDTGPLVAMLDRSEKNHERCVSFLREFRGRLITTEPVITETVYLLGPSFRNQKPALDFVLCGGVEIFPLTQELIKRSSQLMDKYSGIPMDFADATLVALGEQVSVHEILTLDYRGFSAYRTSSRKAFKIFPE